ncbi:hypothetical protein [Rhizobium leguminosarum]|uniref:hypothetical protein n=1 Tax=Rhizobium leguminosarum TaxID=384 RepID=UPI00031E4180|nr:hypothetical protein [Rhizobium leguminosarum]
MALAKNEDVAAVPLRLVWAMRKHVTEERIQQFYHAQAAADMRGLSAPKRGFDDYTTNPRAGLLEACIDHRTSLHLSEAVLDRNGPSQTIPLPILPIEACAGLLPLADYLPPVRTSRWILALLGISDLVCPAVEPQAS